MHTRVAAYILAHRSKCSDPAEHTRTRSSKKLILVPDDHLRQSRGIHSFFTHRGLKEIRLVRGVINFCRPPKPDLLPRAQTSAGQKEIERQRIIACNARARKNMRAEEEEDIMADAYKA